MRFICCHDSFEFFCLDLACRHRLVGDVTPQNSAEIIVCILLMVLNLTLFR